MEHETQNEYIDRIWKDVTPEMRDFLPQLTVPCSCGWNGCRGWRIATMIKSELPTAARSKGATRREER